MPFAFVWAADRFGISTYALRVWLILYLYIYIVYTYKCIYVFVYYMYAYAYNAEKPEERRHDARRLTRSRSLWRQTRRDGRKRPGVERAKGVEWLRWRAAEMDIDR